MAELSLLIKATIVLAAGLAASRCAWRASAAVRAAILSATFAVVVLLPVAGILLAPRPVAIPVSYSTERLILTDDSFASTPAGALRQSPASAATRWRRPPLETVLRAAWIAGATAFAAPVLVALVRLRGVRRRWQPWADGQMLVEPLAARIGGHRTALFLSGDIPAPMTCGVRRPEIGLPLDAASWPPADVKRALLHELEHVRRRDWPVHLVARLACAAYWFNPLAWIAWRQLALECERACDDAVLREEEQTAYANQLVLLARRLSTDAAVPMLSMANRSHLATRVGAVLASDLARGRAGALAVTIVGAAALSVTFAISPLRAVHRLAATDAAQTDRRVAFDVVSIRQNTSATRSQTITSAGNTFVARNVTLQDLLAEAYRVERDQLSGVDGWMTSERFDIEAKGQAAAATWDEQLAMLRTLLEDRFQVRVRREAREAPVYSLVVGRSGSRLRSAAACEPAQAGCGGFRTRPGEITGRRVTVAQIARVLAGPRSGRQVLDATGIAGVFDVELKWTPDPSQLPPGPVPDDVPPFDPSGPSMFTAIEEQLGLRLQPATARMEHLVVERAERPAPNDAQDAPQGAGAADRRLAFEVASIRRNTAGKPLIRGPVVQPGGRVIGENLPVRLMVATAFGVDFDRVAGGPDWINGEGFNIDARAGRETTPEELRAMLRTLLVERFRLVARPETQERDIYTLVRTRADATGPRLRVAGPECAPITPPAGLPAPPPPPPGPSAASQEVPLFATTRLVGCPRMFFGGFISARKISMADFADALDGFARRPIVDRTGLTEAYDLDLTFTPEFAPPGAAPATPTDDAPSLFTALQEQLGLKLEPGRGPVSLLIVERVERPTEN